MKPASTLFLSPCDELPPPSRGRVMQHDKNHFIIKISCPAVSGIVAAVTTYLADNGCYIGEMAQFDDVAKAFDMAWELHDTRQPMRVLLMVSKFDHCLTDLLYRYHKGEMDMTITAIVSNHLDLRPMAEREGIRFIYLPVTQDSKARQEAELMTIIDDTRTDLVVLARYMQILSDDLCRQLSGRAINIHHSFLPGFKGAKPYHQAYQRGVKLIGATAHYVTSDLDEGPIIEQEVQRVDHVYRPDDLVATGRDTETVALSKAVKYHLEHRVFLNQDRTVIFR